jgi:hypothetical protein
MIREHKMAADIRWNIPSEQPSDSEFDEITGAIRETTLCADLTVAVAVFPVSDDRDDSDA